jgi:hypothetical protein
MYPSTTIKKERKKNRTKEEKERSGVFQDSEGAGHEEKSVLSGGVT